MLTLTSSVQHELKGKAARQARALQRLEASLPELRTRYLQHRPNNHQYLTLAHTHPQPDAQGLTQAQRTFKRHKDHYFSALATLELAHQSTATHAVSMLHARRLSELQAVIELEGSARVRLPNRHYFILSYHEVPSFSGVHKSWYVFHFDELNTLVQTKRGGLSIQEARDHARSIISINWPELLDKIL